MSLNLNTYNVLPFYTSTDDWYDNRPTFAGAHSHIYLGRGYIPFTQIAGTASNVLLLVSASVVTGAAIGGFYNSTSPSWDSAVLNAISTPYSIKVQKQSDGKYLITLTDGNTIWDGYYTSTGGIFFDNHRYFTAAQLKQGHVYFCSDFQTLYSECNISGLLSSAIVTDATLTLVNCGTGAETDLTSLVPVTADPIPAAYANDSMAYVISFGDVTLNPYTVGTHFLKLTIDSVTYYSEQFQFTQNLEGLITVSYRRNTPVVTPTEYFTFRRSGSAVRMQMFIPAPLAAPPFEFEEEVTNMDGFEFVSKRVSFIKHHTEFTCSSLFANALRLLWHCNDIKITYEGVTKQVNYMEAPEVRWEESNHLCTVGVNFKTDTILQTNGEIADDDSTTSTHNAYNNSFNMSFN